MMGKRGRQKKKLVPPWTEAGGIVERARGEGNRKGGVGKKKNCG